MKPAFSYIRFSSPEQAKGDSFRRQSEAASTWANANGYTIVRSLQDLGISAYRGQNQQIGDFGEFLAAAEARELPKDSVLIIENLDRMSRQEPLLALSIFLRVIHAGVGIMTLSDGILHTGNYKDDPFGMKLFGALMVMIRAHGESRTKGDRVAAAWSRKRALAREGDIPLTDRIPNWLVSTRDAAGRRVFSEHPVHADTVRRIFAETAQGLGRRMIVKCLNRDRIPTFMGGSGWQTSTIAKVVGNRTALGEYQPRRRDDEGKMVPEGDPLIGYYPAIVDEALWTRANAAIQLRRVNAGGRPQQQSLNLIPGLGRCICGSRMMFLNKGQPPKGGCYHACSAARREAGCTNTRLWRAEAVERYLIHHIDPARLEAAVEPAEVPAVPVRDFNAEIAGLEAQREGAVASILRNPNNALGAEMERQANALSDQIAVLRRQRDDAAAEERAKPHLPTVRAALQNVAEIAETMEGATVADRHALRMRLTHQIRTAFSEIVFSPGTISGLIALPGMPKNMKWVNGLPKPIVIRKDGDTERWFYRHTLFTDDPNNLEALGVDAGWVNARYSGHS